MAIRWMIILQLKTTNVLRATFVDAVAWLLFESTRKINHSLDRNIQNYANRGTQYCWASAIQSKLVNGKILTSTFAISVINKTTHLCSAI